MTGLFTNAWPLLVSTPTIVNFVATNLSTAMAHTSILNSFYTAVYHVGLLKTAITHNVHAWAFLVCVAINLVVVPWYDSRQKRSELYRPILKGLHRYAIKPGRSPE